MTSPIMVETVRKIPLVEQSHIEPMDAETGFPFDDTDFGRERDHTFQDELENIAKRYPEFADHLKFGQSPLRSRFGTQRTRSDRPSEQSSSQDRPEFGRTFGRHFEDFPFTHPSHYFQDAPHTENNQGPQQSSQEDPRQHRPESATSAKPPQAPQSDRSRKPAPGNIQQSNTVDLGQKTEPLDDNRSQRSMSAPPDNRSNQRFVSSINIPITRESGGDMGARTSQPQPQESGQNAKPQGQGKPVERVIPIQVEGRDEPVVPKNVHTSNPQPERVFGHSPGSFTQFLHRGESPRGFRNTEDYFYDQPSYYPSNQGHPQGQSQFQQQQRKENTPPRQAQNQYEGPQQPQHTQHPHQQQQHPQQHHPQQQSPQPQAYQQSFQEDQISKALTQIQNIQKDVLELMSQVDQFKGQPKDKQYLYLDEMLTRNLLKLDNIETEGKDAIRQARKQAISCIEKCISILEAKANANAETERMEAAKQGQPFEPSSDMIASEQQHAAATQDNPNGTLEVAGVARSGSVVVSSTDEQTAMDVSSAPHSSQEDSQTSVQPETKNLTSEAQAKISDVEQPPLPEGAETTEPKTEQMEVSSTSNESQQTSCDNTNQTEEKNDSGAASDKKDKKKGKKKEK